ncbi:uncharacterized protein LOC143259176 [Megalopta genalis]|uniref:uncharacterized protein LOC143259176 n=1 Tax=Megalopta genalis TaxID=115081 RepID=UPI003FD2DD3A
MNSVGNGTSAARLHFHIQSWYDEVEDFDSAEFGYVNYAARGNLSYISFASATISQVGCGRAIYTAGPDESTRRGGSAMALHTIPVGIGDRVETLVCNYGPLDRKTSGELYEDGVPALCPPGTVRSSRYRALCRALPSKNPPQLVGFRGLAQRNKMENVGGAATDETSEIKRTIYLVPTMLLSLTRLSM